MARIDSSSAAEAPPRPTEASALLSPRTAAAPAYLSDSAVYALERPAPQHRHLFYELGTHYATAMSSDEEREEDGDGDEDEEPDAEASDEDEHLGLAPAGFRTHAAPLPHVTWRGRFKKSSPQPVVKGTASRFTRRSRMRSIKKRLKGPPSKRKPLRVSAYCSSDQLHLFKLLKWLERIETGQLPGGELHPDGWRHKMYMGAIHSTCAPPALEGNREETATYRQKDAFYFATGCAVFWGLTRTEEQAHLRALTAFAVGPVKQIEVEDMDYTYGDVSRIANDEITLSSNRASEKLAIAFAMAQSAKLDVFEERVEETIQETKHVPQNLATTGAIRYSLSDISKLIGRLFIVRSDVNLNSDMLDEPDFFWEDDEFQPLYKKTMRYLDVDKRVEVLNTRLDILRELLDVLSQQLVHHHGTKLEMIVIWLIVAEVLIAVVWNMLIKDILGFFPRSDTK